MCSYCHYACHYCYARVTQPYLGLEADEDFAKKIVVTTNMAEVLRGELRKPSWTRERVAAVEGARARLECQQIQLQKVHRTRAPGAPSTTGVPRTRAGRRGGRVPRARDG